MKKLFQNKYLIIVVSVVIGGLIGWLIKPSHDQTIRSSDDQTIESPEDHQIWTCSMHPQIKSNEPGDCPICGMDLIPLESSGQELDPMAISMSPTAMELAQVQTLKVTTGGVLRTLRLNGKVQVDERLLLTQSSHIPGRVERLAVNFTGELIAKGQVLAHVYSPALITAQKELFEARKIRESQPALYSAAIEKLRNWKLNESQINQILSSDEVIEEFPILSNVTGYVSKKLVNSGDYIKEGQALYEIADLSRVWVLLEVHESDLSWIKKGASVSYTVQSIPGNTFNGTISYIDPVIDPKTRVAKARIEVNNSDMALKPEMFVSAAVQGKVSSTDASVVVPGSAVMWTGKRSVVYVMNITDQGVNFTMREVVLGPSLGDAYVIESGLNPGEEIAVNGTFSVDAAAQLAGKPSMMNREGGVTMIGHNHGGATAMDVESAPNTATKSPISPEADEALQFIFEQYFNLKTSLASDDTEGAKASALAMYKAVNKVDMGLFKGVAHEIWMQQSAQIKESLMHVEHMKDINDIRRQFIPVSKAMISLAMYFDPIEAPIYIQHCPMADSNRGADWLSKEKKISNPYFGESMLRCGETTKTLKGNNY